MADEGQPQEKKPKHCGPGPKERELATHLTVAVLHAGRSQDASIDEFAERVASIYGKMLRIVAAEPPTNG